MFKIKKIVTHLAGTKIKQFVQQQEGVYAIMMALLSLPLLGLIVFSVDGSGVVLDRARLSDGLEQASLALTAENNDYRYDDFKLKGKKDEFTTSVSGRNLEITNKFITTYMPLIKEYAFKPECKNLSGKREKNQSITVECNITGSIQRDSWLPLSFNEIKIVPPKVQIGSTATAVKTSEVIFPLEVVFVTDLTGSMNDKIDPKLGSSDRPKIEILKKVLKKIGNDELFSPNDSKISDLKKYNAAKIVSFALGASNRTDSQCVIPYIRNDGSAYYPDKKNPKYTTIPTKEDFQVNIGSSTYVRTHLHNYIDIEKTVASIGSFEHYDKKLNAFEQSDWITFNKGESCLRGMKGKPSTSNWLQNKSDFDSFVESLSAGGSTLTNSGLLIGANLALQTRGGNYNPSTMKTNFQRIIFVLSDGNDILTTGDKGDGEYTKITDRLIDGGMCDAIRDRLDLLQRDNIYPKTPPKIVFIAFGFTPFNEAAWRKCVGEGNYFLANNEEQLLDAIRQSITHQEEVGRNKN